MGPLEVFKCRRFHLPQFLLEHRDASFPRALLLQLELGELGNDSLLDDRPSCLNWTVKLTTVGGNEVCLTELA